MSLRNIQLARLRKFIQTTDEETTKSEAFSTAVHNISPPATVSATGAVNFLAMQGGETPEVSIEVQYKQAGDANWIYPDAGMFENQPNVSEVKFTMYLGITKGYLEVGMVGTISVFD